MKSTYAEHHTQNAVKDMPIIDTGQNEKSNKSHVSTRRLIIPKHRSSLDSAPAWLKIKIQKENEMVQNMPMHKRPKISPMLHKRNKEQKQHLTTVPHINTVNLKIQTNMVPSNDDFWYDDEEIHMSEATCTNTDCKECKSNIIYIEKKLNREMSSSSEEEEPRQTSPFNVNVTTRTKESENIDSIPKHAPTNPFESSESSQIFPTNCRPSMSAKVKTDKEPENKAEGTKLCNINKGLKSTKKIEHHSETFRCYKCPKSFPENWRLTRHMKTCKVWSCIKCSECFPNKRGLHQHSKIHKIKKEKKKTMSYKCECLKIFTNSNIMKKHQEKCQIYRKNQSNAINQIIKQTEVECYDKIMKDRWNNCKMTSFI